jgi:hypothetical protein
MLRTLDVAGLQTLGFPGQGRLSPMLERLADGGSVNTGLGLGILRNGTGHSQGVLLEGNGYLAMKPTLDAVIDSLSK